MQQLVIVQIVNLQRPTIFLEIGRRGDYPTGGFGQFAGAQRAVLQLSNPNGQIETLRDQFHIAVVQHHVDRDIGVFQQEVAQNGGQKVHPEISGYRDAQKARRRGLHRGDQRVGLARVVQNAAGAVVIGKADLGR